MTRSRSQRPGRVGRNDPCPCGSGEKYKHCCLRAGAPPAPRSAGAATGLSTHVDPRLHGLMLGWPPAVILRVATAVQAPDVTQMMTCFDALPELVAQGGPLGHLRFDEQKLAQAVEAAMELDLQPTDAEPYTTLLFRACAARIGTPELVEALVRDAGELVAQGLLPARQLHAAGIAAVTCALLAVDDYEYMPALELLFKVQIREREADVMKGLPSLVRKLGRARASGGLSAAALGELIEENRPLVARLARSPLLRGVLERHADETLARVDRLVQERALPPFLTLPEILRLTAALLRARSGPEPVEPPIPEEVTSGMASSLIDRLAGIAARKETPRELRRVYADLAKAIALDPGHYVMAGLLGALDHAPLARDPRELEHARQIRLDDMKRPGALDGLAALLEEIGDAEGLAYLEAAERDFAAWSEAERA